MVLLVAQRSLTKVRPPCGPCDVRETGNTRADRRQLDTPPESGNLCSMPGEGVWSRDNLGEGFAWCRIHANVGEVGPADAKQGRQIVCFEDRRKGLERDRVNSRVERLSRYRPGHCSERLDGPYRGMNLRIVAFSDWRVQEIGALIRFLHSQKKPDLIVYGRPT